MGRPPCPEILFRETSQPVTYLLFGVKLQLHRELLRKTQAEFAQKIGIEKKKYEDLELAQNEPRSGVILKVQQKLGISLAPEDMVIELTAAERDKVLGRIR